MAENQQSGSNEDEECHAVVPVTEAVVAPQTVVVAGGTFANAILGPHTSTSQFEARNYVNTTVNEVYNYYCESGSKEISTFGPQQRGVEIAMEVAEEGYIRICDDTIMYDKEPLRECTNVYKGYQEHVSEDGPPCRLPVAIKKIVPSNDKHKKEVKHLVTLASHSNVIRIIRSKEHKTPHARVLYIVMELCSLQNLQDYLNENRDNGTPFNFKKTMEFTKQLLNGMKHIHDNGIVHRDVKPENVLLSKDRTQLKFTDFGLGKELRQGHTSTRVTIQGQGTMGFRAPETYSAEKVSKSADIFSLGITMFAMWSNGSHPFGANIHLRDNNIITNTNHDFSGLLITGTQRKDFLDLIGQMLKHDANLRPTIDDVLKHSFFNNATTETIPERQQPLISDFGQPKRVSPNQGHVERAVCKEPATTEHKQAVPSQFGRQERATTNGPFAEETGPKEEGSSSTLRTQSTTQSGTVSGDGMMYSAQEGSTSGCRSQSSAENEDTLSRRKYSLWKGHPMVAGSQPAGEMSHTVILSRLPGCVGWRTIEITYKFPKGSLNGISYERREFKAYLPHHFGLYLPIKAAFEAGQVFDLHYKPGDSVGKIIFGDIPHKLKKTGGPENDGYPDPEYFERLRTSLRNKGFWDSSMDWFFERSDCQSSEKIK